MALISRKSRRRARELRGNMTNAEAILWSRLRRSALNGLKFRRQHPIGPYIADFACSSLRLVIEVDGDTHGTREERSYDARRDSFMGHDGWTIIRVSNAEVFRDLDDVLRSVARTAERLRRGEDLA